MPTNQNIDKLCKQFFSIKIAYLAFNTGLKDKCSSKKNTDTFASYDQGARFGLKAGLYNFDITINQLIASIEQQTRNLILNIFSN
jgi:hypothetical protein